MQYIVFGCGYTGRKALPFLSFERVYAFASNHYLDAEGYERVVDGKMVISFDEMVELAQSDDYLVVIASEKYERQLGEQLREARVTRFFAFHESDVTGLSFVYPGYWLHGKRETVSYNRALSLYHIENYKKIAIYGDNEYLPYLISEIIFHNGADSVVGVIPHNAAHHVRSMGFPVMTLDEARGQIDCLIVNTRWNESPIHAFLDERDHNFEVVDMYDVDKEETIFCNYELMKYKDIHKGKRIFVVGNGPSVRLEDLEKLQRHGEICFGVKQVYRIFDKTNWRPQYIAMSDPLAIEDSWGDIPLIPATVFIFDPVKHSSAFPEFSNIKPGNVEYVHGLFDEHFPYLPKFSTNVVRGTYWGHTIIYDICIPMAAYMGANEIYLLGTDFSYVGNIGRDHFFENYFQNSNIERKVKNSSNVEYEVQGSLVALEKAEAYSRTHGFRIYNATRGGKLEVFERVDFDSLFD